MCYEQPCLAMRDDVVAVRGVQLAAGHPVRTVQGIDKGACITLGGESVRERQPKGTPKAAQAAAKAIVAQDPSALAAFGRQVTALAPSVIDELAEIEPPVLVIVGSEDEAFRRAAEVMSAKLPNAVHHIVEGAGHILNIEQAGEFDAALLEFLATL